jgi:serine carboxypeptidase-like clade 2
LGDSQAYKTGDKLTFNPFGWTNLTNLLFIDSPAGVGFSINKDPKYEYNDLNTVKDNLFALKYFFKNKFPEYANTTFYIAGESYAGKYIPDLAIKIISDNQNNPNPIRIKGILIGNGLLSWADLERNRV